MYRKKRKRTQIQLHIVISFNCCCCGCCCFFLRFWISTCFFLEMSTSVSDVYACLRNNFPYLFRSSWTSNLEPFLDRQTKVLLACPRNGRPDCVTVFHILFRRFHSFDLPFLPLFSPCNHFSGRHSRVGYAYRLAVRLMRYHSMRIWARKRTKIVIIWSSRGTERAEKKNMI